MKTDKLFVCLNNLKQMIRPKYGLKLLEYSLKKSLMTVLG